MARLDLRRVTLVCFENRYPMRAISLLAGMCELAEFGDVKLLNHFQGYAQFNYWENYEAWKYVSTEFSLNVHLDGYIIDPDRWEDAFLDYDYIGAPWPKHSEPWRVGNGGFCIKSRRLLQRVSQLPWHDVPADRLVCETHRALLEGEGFKFAPVDVAARFSTESEIPESVSRSFGFHNSRNYPEWP